MMIGNKSLAVLAVAALFALGCHTVLAEELELLSGETVTITPQEEAARDTCQDLLQEAMATEGNYDALKEVLYRQYDQVNPGPYVVCKDIETDDDKTFISIHPFNPLQGVPREDWGEYFLAKGDTIEELNEFVDAHKDMEEYAINNTGEYFYADLPVKQTSNTSLTLEGKETTDRYFLVSGAENTSWTGPGKDYFVCHCPFTEIPEESRDNTNVPKSSNSSETRGALSTVSSLLGMLLLALLHFA